jgi:hypothetical protein
MKYEYIECGCCGQYHRIDYYGDCRNDAERFTFEDIPETDNILTLEEQMENEDE